MRREAMTMKLEAADVDQAKDAMEVHRLQDNEHDEEDVAKENPWEIESMYEVIEWTAHFPQGENKENMQELGEMGDGARDEECTRRKRPERKVRTKTKTRLQKGRQWVKKRWQQNCSKRDGCKKGSRMHKEHKTGGKSKARQRRGCEKRGSH